MNCHATDFPLSGFNHSQPDQIGFEGEIVIVIVIFLMASSPLLKRMGPFNTPRYG